MLAEDDVSDDDRDSGEGVLSFNFLLNFFFSYYIFGVLLTLHLNLPDFNFFKVKFESLDDFQQLLRDEPCFIGNHFLTF